MSTSTSPTWPGPSIASSSSAPRKVGEFDEFGFRWTTLADPEGNEFDVVAAG